MCRVWLLPDTSDGHCPQIFHSFTVYVKGASPFEQMYFEISFEELEVIKKMTGCIKPCKYLEYNFHGAGLPTFFKPPGDHFAFSLLAQERYISVEKEELLYPSSTMIAEVGGILGLFLGVSFMTVLDGAMLLKHNIAP